MSVDSENIDIADSLIDDAVETVKALAETDDEHVGEEWGLNGEPTTAKVAQTLGYSEGHVQKALNVAREAGKVKRSGSLRGPGKKGVVATWSPPESAIDNETPGERRWI